MTQKILIYDDHCPLCSWYTNLFVSFGLLNKDGRKPFSTLDASLSRLIEPGRSRNEIPLVDLQTGQTWYGIDALLEILGQKNALVKKIGNWLLVNWILKKLYKLISYNRKVIVATKCGKGEIDCSPDINYFYRFLFLGTCLVANTLALSQFHNNLFEGLSLYDASLIQLQYAHFVLVFINCLLATNFHREKALEYLGQVNMLALLSVLMIIPVSIAGSMVALPEFFLVGYLSVVTLVIFREYFRRMNYAGLLGRNNWVTALNFLCITGFALFIFK